MRWFKHMSNSLLDEKIQAMMDEFGLIGYGFYFAVLERIASKLDNKNVCEITYSLSNWCRILAVKRKNSVENMFDKTHELGLFIVNKNGNGISVNCPRLKDYRDEWTSRTLGKTPEQLPSDSRVTPEENIDTDTDTEPDTDTEQKKRIKREENAADFERFWTAYKMKDGRHKGGKREAIDLWCKLPDTEKKLAFDLLPEYKKTKEWVDGYMVQPVRYIRRKYWDGLPQQNCATCNGKGWYYREWSDDATGRSMKRQKQPCDKCEAKPNEPIDYDTVETIT